ncbi:MAG: hypothetical protein Ct9H300mP6_04210 [Gammaproteobacteria bacterium]|nr:MAG: hypothetical protein Ct9H300mP6_04210 [Gammaproteobacteria bacterium]
MDGTVIDVRVFCREGVEKDQRSNEIEVAEIDAVRKDLKDQLRIMETDIFNRVQSYSSIKSQNRKKVLKIDKDYLENLKKKMV